MASKSKTPQPSWSFETSMSHVEDLIEQLETGNLPIAEVLAQFEQAVATLKQCEDYLTEKQAQVNLLIETLE